MTARNEDVHDGTTRRFGETEAVRVEAMARLAAAGDDRSRRQLVELLDPLANGAARRRLPTRLGRTLRVNMRGPVPVMPHSPAWRPP